jgi:hypothetical protein
MPPRCPLAIAAAAAVALALSPSPARAEEEWYGGEVLAADAIGWALIIGGATADAWPVSALGVGGVLLGGPIIHAAHDNYGRAGISLGLRIGGPLLGLGLGAAIDKNSHSFIPAGPIIGAFLGYVAGAIADIALVAYEDDSPAAAPRLISIGGRF